MKRIALLVLVSLLSATSSRAAAQRREDPGVEIGGGVLLLPAAFGVALGVGLWAGGGLTSCSGSDGWTEQQACRDALQPKQRRGWLIGAGVGSVIAAVGIGLIVHGALRLRRLNQTSFIGRMTVEPTQLARGGYGLLASGRF